MFEAFENMFQWKLEKEGGSSDSIEFSGPEVIRGIVEKYGGYSFGNGLYRIVSASNYNEWMERISFAFPKDDDVLACFGFDWRGNAFALSSGNPVKGRPSTLLLDIGAASVVQIPYDIEAFHNKEVVGHSESIFDAELYREWLSSGGSSPSYDECVGYKIPLFLNGSDDLENLELSSLHLYWDIHGQIMRQVIWEIE
jgi:hypothetical protein